MSDSKNDLKLYILVIKERLTMPQCSVQACHALAEYLTEYGKLDVVIEWADHHKTIVVLTATQNQALDCACCYQLNGNTCSLFHEPNIGNVLTAIAFEPVIEKIGARYFSKLDLLG